MEDPNSRVGSTQYFRSVEKASMLCAGVSAGSICMHGSAAKQRSCSIIEASGTVGLGRVTGGSPA